MLFVQRFIAADITDSVRGERSAGKSSAVSKVEGAGSSRVEGDTDAPEYTASRTQVREQQVRNVKSVCLTNPY